MWSRDYFLSSLALATAVLCAPVQDAGQRTPTVWLAGDSTMAVDGGPIEGKNYPKQLMNDRYRSFVQQRMER